MCVNKWQQKSTSTAENTKKIKLPSNCVVKNILEYHRLTTLDLEDDFWERENPLSVPPRYLFYIRAVFKLD